MQTTACYQDKTISKFLRTLRKKLLLFIKKSSDLVIRYNTSKIKKNIKNRYSILAYYRFEEESHFIKDFETFTLPTLKKKIKNLDFTIRIYTIPLYISVFINIISKVIFLYFYKHFIYFYYILT